MFVRKPLAALLSLALAVSFLPASAMAEVIAQSQAEAALVEYRIDAQDDSAAWMSFDTADEAVEAGDKDAADLLGQPVGKIELRLEGIEGLVEASTRARGEEWPEEWVTRDAEATDPFADVRIRLLDGADETNDVWYRVHVGDAWLDWARNGETAAPDNDRGVVDDMQVLLLSKDESERFIGSGYTSSAAEEEGEGTDEEGAGQDQEAPVDGGLDSEESEALEGTQAVDEQNSAVEVVEDQKDDEASVSVATESVAAVEPEATTSVPTVTYQVHAQDYGWLGKVTNGALGGTMGKSKRLEGIKISLPKGTKGGISYQVHAQDYGWMGEVSNGALGGTSGESKRLEGIKISLTGDVATEYDVWYRVHCQDYGWMSWVKNGKQAGTVGKSKRLEGIQIVLRPKGQSAPTDLNSLPRSHDVVNNVETGTPILTYCGHVQNIGWTSWVSNGGVAGTTGRSLRVEALKADIVGGSLSGEVQINPHVQDIGWMGYARQGSIAGTEGRSKRVEAIRVKLTGDLSKKYDIWYRVHAQNLGWMGWTSNGGSAGTQGFSYRLEAIQIKMVPKGSKAPGSTNQPFLNGNSIGKIGYQNPSGYYQVSCKNVPAPSGSRWPFNYVTPSRIAVNASRSACVNAFIQRAREYVGTPYVWDYACAPGVGVDCIGLVYQCAYACGMNMGTGTGNNDFNPWAHYVTGSSGWHSHDANNFWNYGKALHVPLSARKKGDVISWSGHVAIYIGGDQIIEAYTGSGVIYNSLWAHGTPRGCIRLFQ